MSGHIRCAIYTRKSSEEGLEQSFNSLDAQREACEAFIRSQRHEGWQALAAKYDDGGYSGGTMDRPALKQLISDIAAGKVNTVVVYKVDRLTRSLADFAKIIDQFDARHVSFVSVTQQFNTTSSMGRLTLNVLLSFAQFEREVTGERIRDKIAASKAKGMWMGGRVPLGYDLRERKLYINIEEAERIREIFHQYICLGCVSALKDHLDKGSLRSKLRMGDRRRIGGDRFSRGALYKLLRNHLYAGEIAHKENVYPGDHEAIIDRETWDQVQKMLDENQQGERSRTRATRGSLLTGLLFDEAGNRLTPTHASKGGKRYRYYTSQAIIRRKKGDGSTGRIPALDLERAVVDRVQEFLRSPLEILSAVKEVAGGEGNYEKLLRGASQMAREWVSLLTSEQETLFKSTVDRIIVNGDSIEIRLNLKSLFAALQPEKPDEFEDHNAVDESQVVALSCPFETVHRGKALRLVLGNDQRPSSESTTAIIRAIARAKCWYDQIVAGQVAGIPQLALEYGVSRRYIKKILPCAWLGPQFVEAILKGKCSPQLTLESLVQNLPIRWDGQQSIVERWGFAHKMHQAKTRSDHCISRQENPTSRP
jgi:DNA invertase Pin-like site-specific DNA recombinase